MKCETLREGYTDSPIDYSRLYRRKDFTYLNWDNQDHRLLLLKGPTTVAKALELDIIRETLPIVVFDELHKYRHWKTFLKGFFDTYQEKIRIIVTESSTLDILHIGGDSLMGRYFPYRVHPISVAESLRTTIHTAPINPPQAIDSSIFDVLFHFGGFPEPFLNRTPTFSYRWKGLRQEQLFREDIRDLGRIHEIDQLEMLATLIKHQAGQLTNYSNLANKIRVSADTIRRWLHVLNAFYYCFTIKPWSNNISRALLKEPKIYLWDWSDVEDIGQRSENFVASHLLKAIHFWTDQGFGSFGLYFIRDKEKREVDFLVTKDQKPWFLVEVKHSDTVISRSLEIFQRQTQAAHAFQVVIEKEYVNVDCFSFQEPVVVPARTFLSQLI